METKREYIETCKHDKHIYSLGTRWCDNGYEQNLYDCKNCPGYEPIGEVEVTINSTHEDCEPIYIEIKDGTLHSDKIIENKPIENKPIENKPMKQEFIDDIMNRVKKAEEKIRNYYIYGHDINLHIEKAANNIDYVKK